MSAEAVDRSPGGAVAAAAAGPVAFTRRALASVTGRLALTAVCSVGAAWVHENHDPGALCPLRRLTGVPCPLCGSTTLFMEAGAGHWGAALTANPATVLVFLGFLAWPVLRFDPVDWWARLPATKRYTGLGVVLALSWLWQLHRFGFLG